LRKPKQEASPNSAIHDVHDCDFVCSKNLNTSQSSHASPQHAARNGAKPEQSRAGVYRPNAVCSQSAVSPLFPPHWCSLGGMSSTLVFLFVMSVFSFYRRLAESLLVGSGARHIEPRTIHSQYDPKTNSIFPEFFT
jgi:hypothetical protein